MYSLDHWKTMFSKPDVRSKYLAYVDSWEKRINSFLSFDKESIEDGSIVNNPQNGSLASLPFGVKDNIAVEGRRLSCGSKMLENLKAPYTATAVERLMENGAVPVGKTNLDEFGMGSSTDNSAFATTNNPFDQTRVAGGSSGGSAAAVAAGLVPFALGSDTGGSIRQPAAFCGVYGLKPTYGTVSRFGLVAYASSLEVIGVISRSVEIMEKTFHVMKGIDENDHTSVEPLTSEGKKPSKTIGVLTGITDLSPQVENSYNKTINSLKKLGYEIREIKLPMLEYVVPAYYTIAAAEASANLARYNGIRYGYSPEYAENPEELMKKSRDEGFGDEVKLRVLLGTYVLRSGFQDQYYQRAQKIRTAIRNDLDKVFSEVELIMAPVFPVPAFKHGEEGLTPFQQKMADKFTATANLAGIPALSFPASMEEGMPVGMQFLAPLHGENRLFHAASKFEQFFPAPKPEGFSDDWSLT